MTFSIVARSDDGNSWGVAVASKFLAVGAAVPAGEAGVGAIATQAYANLAYRPDGLAYLRAGHDATKTVELLTKADDQRAERQLGVVDAGGGAATFTGERCNVWAGGHAGDGFAIQGNILTGPEVVEAMVAAWRGHGDVPFAHRLLEALVAGDSVGGDRRGRQSAALLVVSPGAGYGGGSDVAIDLRVDDHERPITELRRLVGLHEIFFGTPVASAMIPIEGIEDELVQLLTAVGFRPESSGLGAIRQALWDWGAVENLEERIPEEPLVDPVVLDLLRSKAVPPA